MTDKQILIGEINKIIFRAENLILQKRWQEANIQIKNGLNILGNRYDSPGLLDDTGQTLIHACSYERDGLHEKAVRLRLRVLKDRLSEYKSNP